jgi:2-hydroxychromene-2-carboxylate isomerase
MSGANATDPARFDALCRELYVDPTALADEQIKSLLRRNTEHAAARGVFGVPSFVVDGEVFWGADAIDFFKAFLADPVVLRNDEIHRVDGLPTGARRQP